MRKLEIVFSKSKKFLPFASWGIRLWTWKPYSHVSRKVILYGDIPMYYQANEGKVNYEHQSIFNEKHEIIVSYEIEVPEELYMSISRACLEDAGKPYGVLQNIGIMYVDIMKLFGKKVDNPWKKGRNCSELIYTKVFKPMYPELDYNPDTIKPHEIEEIIFKKYIK